MAITVPQTLTNPNLRPQGSGRSNIRPSTGVDFQPAINTLETFIDTQEKQRLQDVNKAEEQNRQFVRTKYQNELNAAAIEAQAQVTSVTGENAIEQSKKTGDELQKRINDISNKLPEKYRAQLSPIGDSYFNKYRSVAIPYTAAQARKLKEQAYDTRVKDVIDDTALLSGDPESFEAALASVGAAVEERARAKYGGDLSQGLPPGADAQELIDREKRLAYSATVRQAIELQAKQGLVTPAAELAKKYNVDLTPGDAKAVIAALDQARNKSDSDIALQLVRSAETAYPEDLKSQEAFLRSNATSTKMYREGVSIIRANEAIRTGAQRQQKDAQTAQAYDIADQVVSGQATVKELMDVAPDSIKNSILTYVDRRARGVGIPTDRQVFKRLDEKYTADPDGFMSYDLNTERGNLSAEDFKYFRNLQTRRREILETNQNRLLMGTDSLVDSIASEFAKSNGLYSDEDIAKVRQLARQAQYDIVSDGLAKRPLEVQIQIYKALQDSAFVPEEQPEYPWYNPRGWFQGEPEMILNDRLNVGRPNMQGQNLSERQNAGAPPESAEVDPTWTFALQEEMRSRNIPITPEALKQRYDWLRTAGKDLSQPYRGK